MDGASGPQRSCVVTSQIRDDWTANCSGLTFSRIASKPEPSTDDLIEYINGFAQTVRDIFDSYRFSDHVRHLDRAKLLGKVIQQFGRIDLRPTVVDDATMGQIFEACLVRIARISGTAGEHYTAPDAAQLVADLLDAEQGAKLKTPARISIYDPAAGTGGLLSAMRARLQDRSPATLVKLYGQDISVDAYATCKARLLLNGEDIRHIRLGDSLTDDGFSQMTFDLMLCNPPYGLHWKAIESTIEDDRRRLGTKGRFWTGLPRTSDAQMLFLLHLISKMAAPDDEQHGSRIALITNGSPLWVGDAGSGESDVRKYLLDHDLLDAVIALPGGLYYNTPIPTFVWIIANGKRDARVGHVQLIDGAGLFNKMQDTVGSKTREVSPAHAREITRLYTSCAEDEHSKILPNEAFIRRSTSEGRVEADRRPYAGIRFPAVFLTDQLERLAERTSQRALEFENVVAEVSAVKSKNVAERSESANIVYLPVVGLGNALTSLTGSRANNYFRLVIRDDVAEARYVAAFYNSVLGRSVREACSSGTVPRLSRSGLADSRIVLPAPDLQVACLEADALITNLTSELSAIRTDIWQNPSLVIRCVDRIRSVNRADTLLTWLDALPYPLSSILLSYEAAGDDQKAQYETLLHFFEALAEFVASVFLSAVTESSAQSARMKYPLRADAPLRSPLRRSTFGSWVELLSRMRAFAGVLRRGSEDQRAALTQSFGTENPLILDMLLSDTAVAVIRQAKDIRDSVKGHGGMVTSKGARATHAQLAGLLADIRSIYAQTWDSFPLYRAGVCSHGRNTIVQTADRIMGRSVPFKRTKVVVSDPVYEGNLFILADGGNQPISILPLLKVGVTPDLPDTACYFYNRNRDGEARYVSYQFDSEPEIIERSADVLSSLARIMAITDAKEKRRDAVG